MLCSICHWKGLETQTSMLVGQIDNAQQIKVTVDLQSAFRKMLCLRAALEKTMVNYISLES